MLRLRIKDPTLILEAEGESRERTSRLTTGVTEGDELVLDSAVGLTLDGSIYHPYLLGLWLYSEVGVTRQDVEIRTSSGTVQDHDEDDVLQRYDGRINILKRKPYATTLYGLRYDFHRSRDFFVSEQVIGERYGIRSGYKSGPWPVEMAVYHSDEDTTGSQITERQQDTYFVGTTNQRSNDSRTRISYTLDDIVNVQNARLTQDGPVHNVRLSDTSYFGGDRLTRLLSNVTAYDRDSTPIRSRSLTLRERLGLQHRPHLRSDYEYVFGRRETGPADNTFHQVLGALQHQLYESLTSTAEFDVYETRDSSNGNSADTQRYGGGFNEQYTKRLSEEARLNAGLGLWLRHTDREAAGEALQIIDERVRLVSGEISLLQSPFVIESRIDVTDTSGTIQYFQGLDYLVSTRDAFTEIQRVIGGNIPDRSVVLVDYEVQSQPSGDYWTYENRSYVRISFLDNLLSLYARVDVIDNRGAEELVVADVGRRVVGVDVSVRWLRAGAEYEDNSSDTLPYEGYRLFQNFNMRPTRDSILSLDLAQRQITYDDTGETDQVYAYIGRFRTRPVRSLAFSVEGGYLSERRVGFDRDRFTGRADIEFRMGMTIVRAGYEYEDDEQSEEDLKENRFWVRLRRSF